MKAIETYYKGYRFRSRAEARWAVFFDALGAAWMYEPDGVELQNGMWYLPDFYLPESNTFVEVKGVLSEKEAAKINAFASECGKAVVVGYSDMTFAAYVWFGEYGCVEYLIEKDFSFLCECRRCHRMFFGENVGYYGCKCCGYYDGDNTFDIALDGTLDGWNTNSYHRAYLAVKDARQARFEHGETPKIRAYA